jgi:hypothetical protein
MALRHFPVAVLCAHLITALTSAERAIDREIDPFHVSALKQSRTPNIFTVPELYSGHRGWRALRRLQASDEDTTTAHLGHRVDHEFLGSTDVGFIDYNVRSLSKHGLVHLGDYHDILEGAQWSCSPVDAGEKVTLPENSRLPERIPVGVTLGAPSGAPQEAVEHLYERLLVVQTEGKAAESFIDFDHTFLDSPAGFPYGSDCSRLIPAMAPLYRITEARKQEAEGSKALIELTLSPAETKDAYHHMDLNMRWTPDTEGEIERRRLAGKDIGVDVRGRRRQLFSDLTKDYRFAVNYDLDAMRVSNPKISILSNGVLDCDNCYAFFKATFVVRFRFCFAYDIGVTGGWIASDMLTTTTGVNALIDGGYGPSGYNNADNKDCRDLAISSAMKNGWYYASMNSDYRFDASILFEAYLEGTAGFGFGLSTMGVSQPGTVGSCPTGATDSSVCEPVSTSFQVPASVAMAVTGVSAEFTIGVGVAALYSGTVDAQASFGVKAAAGSSTTPFKFGGKVNIGSLRRFASSVTTACTPLLTNPTYTNLQNCINAVGSAATGYVTLPLSYSAKPISYKLNTATIQGQIDATLFVTVAAKLFGGVVPLKTSAKFRSLTTVKRGSGSSTTVSALTTAPTSWLRALQTTSGTPDTLQTCPSSSGFATLDQSTGASVGVDAITVGGVLDAFKLGSAITTTLSLFGGILDAQLTPKVVLSQDPGKTANVLSACLPAGKTVQGYVRPPSFSATVGTPGSVITTSGAGSNVQGSEAAPTDETSANSSSSSGVPMVIIIGAAAGGAVVLLAIALIVFFVVRSQRSVGRVNNTAKGSNVIVATTMQQGGVPQSYAVNGQYGGYGGYGSPPPPQPPQQQQQWYANPAAGHGQGQGQRNGAPPIRAF